jgi:hypothetical protein
VIANHVQKGLSCGEVSAAEDRLSISSPNLDLLNKSQSILVFARRFFIGCLGTRIDDHTDRIDPSRIDLLDDHFNRCLLDPVAVNKQMKGQGILAWPCCRDNRFSYSHGDSLLFTCALHALYMWSRRTLQLFRKTLAFDLERL